MPEEATPHQPDASPAPEPGEADLCAMVEAMEEPALLTRADLEYPGPTIVAVSSGLCVLTGYTRPELLGRSPRLFQGPLTSRVVLDRLRATCAAGERFIGEAVNYRKDGSAYLLQWAIEPVRHEGRVTHFFSLQRDVTALRDYAGPWIETATRLQEALAVSSEQLATILEAALVLGRASRAPRPHDLHALRKRLLEVAARSPASPRGRPPGAGPDRQP